MKKFSIRLKIILTTIVLLLSTANYTVAEPSVLEILTGRAEQTQSAASLVQRGRAKIEQGNFRGAIADFNEALRLNPQLSQAYYYRGIAQRQLESSPSFREDYVQALQVRGIARLQLGDHQGAIADLNYVLAHNPNSSVDYLNRGLAHLALGQTQLARADFRQARTIEPPLSIAESHQESEDHLLFNEEQVEIAVKNATEKGGLILRQSR